MIKRSSISYGIHGFYTKRIQLLSSSLLWYQVSTKPHETTQIVRVLWRLSSKVSADMDLAGNQSAMPKLDVCNMKPLKKCTCFACCDEEPWMKYKVRWSSPRKGSPISWLHFFPAEQRFRVSVDVLPGRIPVARFTIKELSSII